MVFLRKTVVGLLDVGSGCILVDAEGSVRVGYCGGGRGCVEVLATMLDYCRDGREFVTYSY
jgi:hypothetical protein